MESRMTAGTWCYCGNCRHQTGFFSFRADELHYRGIIRCCERRGLFLCAVLLALLCPPCFRTLNPARSGGVRAHSRKQHGKAGDGGVVEGFSFQVDGRKQDAFVPALLADVLCRSAGALLAEVHAVGAEALSQGPVVEVAA